MTTRTHAEPEKPHSKIAFLDRDGVINVNPPPHEYVTRIEDFVLTDGILETLKALQAGGFEFIVVTNQRGVARGLLSEEDLRRIHEYMKETLGHHGIGILDVFYCPHEKDMCACRKPKDGLLRQAMAAYPVDLAVSLLISDSAVDIGMAEGFGVRRGFLVPVNHPEAMLADYTREL